MILKVDPSRFRGEPMTLHPIGEGDYAVAVDDLRAGRIMYQVRGNSRGEWFWTLTAGRVAKVVEI